LQSASIVVAMSSQKNGSGTADMSFRAHAAPRSIANSTLEICARLCRFLT
jgi:hypothetical protein